MKIKNNTLYIVLYFAMFFVHFGIWQILQIGLETTFIKYYLFLTVLFITVLTVLSLLQKIYPGYIGFSFMGLVLFKLMIMFLVMKKLDLSAVPFYKIHFIFPYLISLVLETLYAIKLIKTQDAEPATKDEKNQ